MFIFAITVRYNFANDTVFFKYFRGVQKLYTMSYIWYTPLGVLICLTVGMVASLVTGNMFTLFKPIFVSITFDTVKSGWTGVTQWLSGRVLDSRQRGRGFEPHRRQCVVVLEQDRFILA